MKKSLSPAAQTRLLKTLKARFEANQSRHLGLEWDKVQQRLESAPAKLWSLQQMEDSAGEPDTIGLDIPTGQYIFVDCAPESPLGRRSLCFDQPAWEARKKNRPAGNAITMAKEMGVELLTEEQYRQLQTLGKFDLKTSSWIQTPSVIRQLGGALFCDRRYDHVFTYHNGADSYYAARGFRTILFV
jgi:hypothetical protein